MSNYHCLGCSTTPTSIGASIADIFSAAGQGVQSVVDWRSKSNADEAATKASAADLDKSVTADKTAIAADATAAFSADQKLASADADAAAAQIAWQASSAAAMGLSPDNQKKRSDAAQKAVAQATSDWQLATAGKNALAVKQAKFKVDAAQKLYTLTQNAMFVDVGKKGGDMSDHPGAKPSKDSGGTNWGLVVGVGAALAAGVGGLVWWLKRR